MGNNLYFAGIGSRQTPQSVQDLMVGIGRYLADRSWILRSGGAVGADMAFESGCDEVHGRKEIFLPWKGYNSNKSTF